MSLWELRLLSRNQRQITRTVKEERRNDEVPFLWTGFVCLSVCLLLWTYFVCLSSFMDRLCMFVYLSVCLSLCPLFINRLCLFVYLSVCLFVLFYDQTWPDFLHGEFLCLFVLLAIVVSVSVSVLCVCLFVFSVYIT